MDHKRKLHICFVGPMLGRHPGWVPNPSEYLAPRLEERGYQCSLVSNKLNRYHRLVDILAIIWRQRKQFDIICLQVYGGPSFVVEDAASWFARRLGLPVLMTLRGGELPVFFQRFPAWTRRVLRRAHMIVTPSGFLSQTASQYGLQARIIPNAIEIENYPFRLRSVVQPHLLWMRTFHEIYNPLLAVEAFSQVKRTYPHARLTMGGQEKGLLGIVRQRVHEAGLDDSVRFVGFLQIDDKKREFAGHDIFLNTNRVDNMPVSIVEAAAFGMPIVATSVGGVPYLLQDGENGVLVPDEDAKAMADAVRRVLEEPGLAERLSRNARKLGEQHDWSVVVPQWESLFHKMMEFQV